MSSRAADAKAEQERLIAELSDLAMRILRSGGAGALAACSAAMVEGAAAAMPVACIPEFTRSLLERVASGARMAGHTVEVVDVSAPLKPTGSVH